ncbi:MAG: CsbD family protein [Acidobacteriota bacterium]
MSTTSGSTMKGKFDEVAGKVKQSVGETMGSEKMANAGAAQQVKGHAEQAWGAVKEGAQDMKDRNQPRAEEGAHDIREKVTSAAQNAKEHIQHGVDKMRGKDDRDM